MKKAIKFSMAFILMVTAILVIPKVSNAETREVTDESSLISEISSANPGDTISIQDNITITQPIVIAKELIIDGNGHRLTGSSDWTSTSGNQTMFTAQLSDAKLTLKDIYLVNGPKYGVQAYDGATVILDNVSITDFKYGGVLVNGGNLEVRDLHLGRNGTGDNNGIEIDKGAAATHNPTLTMNGVLLSDQGENVVRIADNGNLTEFTITNTDTTTNKVLVAGDRVLFTDENNNVLSETTLPENATANTEAEQVVITLISNDNINKIAINKGETITEDLLKSHITLEANYQIEGYFTDENYTTAYDFTSPVNTDTTIYAKISEIPATPEPEPEPPVEEEKDETPKTGVENYLGLAVLAIILSSAVMIAMKKKNNKIER